MRRSILVFDDDAGLFPLLHGLLREAGYRVVAATSAHDARAVALREPVTLIVLDLWWGGWPTGLDVLRELRDAPETADVPVLLCSADRRALGDYAEDWRALGCETLAKPFALDALLARVARLTDAAGDTARHTPDARPPGPAMDDSHA